MAVCQHQDWARHKTACRETAASSGTQPGAAVNSARATLLKAVLAGFFVSHQGDLALDTFRMSSAASALHGTYYVRLQFLA